METRQKKLNGILLTLLMALVAISVGYAAMQSVLTITTNTVTQSTQSWNVGFVPGTATATAGGTSATGRSCGNATLTASSVTVAATTLSKPGDSCTYALQIKNSGTITAELATIVPSAPTSTSCTTTSATTSASAQMVCGNITYKLVGNAAGTQNFVTGTTLAANATTTAYLVIAYTGSEPSGSQISQAAGKFTLTYNQK
jgi:uncharacterized repeat protein (TIGR01451 family)